jgi:hypothetical protein
MLSGNRSAARFFVMSEYSLLSTKNNPVMH